MTRSTRVSRYRAQLDAAEVRNSKIFAEGVILLTMEQRLAELLQLGELLAQCRAAGLTPELAPSKGGTDHD